MGMDSGMMEIDSVDFQLLAARASNFASVPGTPSAIAVKDFLAQFPLPILFSVLGKNDEFVPIVVQTLERIFNSPYGKGLLLEAMPYASLGLNAGSSSIRHLACFSISKMLEDSDVHGDALLQTVSSLQLVGPLLAALRDEDTSVAKQASEALVHLANITQSGSGLELIFSDGSLVEMAANGSALVRIRALSLMAKLHGLSEVAALAVEHSGILILLEKEITNEKDTLARISALELICEIAATPTGAKLLLRGNFVRLLISLIRNFDVDAMVRSRSMTVGARLISSFQTAVTENDAVEIIDGIVSALNRLEESDESSSQSSIEKEDAIDALGQIGIPVHGAQLLLRSPQPAAKYVADSALTRKDNRIQLVGVGALAAIAGSERKETLLGEQFECCLRNVIYDNISANHSLGAKLLSLLRHTPEMRLSCYRLMVALACRSWFTLEVIPYKDIIDLVVEARTDSTKEGMEWRHACCVALYTASTAAGQLFSKESTEKLSAAVRRGPYSSKEYSEAIPLVVTEDRF